ncbi:hypothetical protein SAMN05192533_12517 [Mesobacillus persicus]|uniref:Uncharacterized protein n=1 Tax=Mesobacillus persicus TaxID=930146 RepID=A0A1H8K7L8_9BACI|nr:hypothetical protein [Mesobacillus persicus]SEN88825.1 hypothetical protein SAMN05192533_12517 [Mesobacillus persicus]
MTLPTKDKYFEAVSDLKRLNNEVFLDDLKAEIEGFLDELNSTSDYLEESFKEQSKKTINSAQALLRASDNNKEKLNKDITENLEEIKAANFSFIEAERSLLEGSYERIKQMITTLQCMQQKVEQDLHAKYTEIDLSLKTNVEQLGNSTKRFIQELTVVNQSNKDHLEQNNRYVKFVEEEVQGLQQHMVLYINQQLEFVGKLQGLLESYSKEFKTQERKLDTTLVIREQELTQNVTTILSRFKESQEENIAALEKRNRLQLKLLIGVIVLQGIGIGVGVIL